MGSSPASIVNRSLDLIGRSDLVVGDIGEGTEAARPALRNYAPAMRQLLRAAHWSFARRQAPMTLLGDATGQTAGVGTVVQAPWTYCYALPPDSLKVRFLPWNSNPIQPNPPIVTNLNQAPLNAIRLVPAPFLMGISSDYPVQEGCYLTWDDLPDWAGTPGVGPEQRTVIYTNVPPQPQGSASPTIYPSLVYTGLVIYPAQWDSLFEEAMVNYLAQKLAMPLVQDKKFALAVRAHAIDATKNMLTEARAASANESAFPQTISRQASWVVARNAGGGNWWGRGGVSDGAYGGPGCLWGSFDAIGFSDGSVY